MKFFTSLVTNCHAYIARIKIDPKNVKITNILSAVSYDYMFSSSWRKQKWDQKKLIEDLTVLHTIRPITIRVEWLTFPITRSTHPIITYHYQGWWFVVMWYQYSFRTIVAKEGNKEIFCLNTTYIFIHWNKASYYVLVHALEVKIRTAISAKKLSA